jgi:hypothetical protein
MYLAFDPGKTTGWARFKDDGSADGYGQVSINELIGLCEQWKVEDLEGDSIIAIIVEDFVLFKHKAVQQTGSKMEASQAIGILRALASATGAKFVLQPSNIKSTAEKFTQLKPPSNHKNSHWVDAFNHGAYYLINAGIRKTQLEMDNEKA